MKVIDGGVTAAKGFEAAGAEAAIKYQNRKDMAMVYSKVPCKAAGTFTTNVVKAAPVLWDRDIVANSEYAQAVVVNAGIANACTGKQGLDYCRREAEVTGRLLGIPAEAVLVGSTGVIGMQLPMDRIEAGIAKLVEAKSDTLEAGHTAACSIMTTDTISKEIAVSFELDGKEITVGGMSKGSGMIHPNMATTLNFITSDCAVSSHMLQKALSEIVKVTYNCLSVDGDTSTNDMVSLMANGLAGNEEITCEGEEFDTFKNALYEVMANLTRMLAKDGEGASKLLECICDGAPDKDTAITVAKSVVCSSLFKAAMFGEDANWGRVLCAIGYADAEFDINKVDVDLRSKYGTVEVCKNGSGIEFSEEKAAKVLSSDEIYIDINLNQGNENATAWGCDLTYDYVKINGDYRT